MQKINRNEFLRYAGAAAATLAVPGMGIGLSSCGTAGKSLPEMHLHYQGLKTLRPFDPDVDADGYLWHGHYRFFKTNLATNTSTEIDATPMDGKPFSAVFCQGDKVYVVVQKSPYLYAYNRVTGEFEKHELPEPESNIWFGVRVPGDPRLYLYARNLSKLIIWDCDVDKGHAIDYPGEMDLWSGFHIPGDDAIFSFTLDAKPARLVRFDLKTQQYDAVIEAPEPDLEITGVNPVGDSVYCADRFTGRIFPFNYVTREWGSPLHAPGLGTEFAFIGLGCSYRGRALYCLSTYQGQMRYDFNTNKYLSKAEEDIGIDGLPHHFINKYLVLEPNAGQFSYLEAPIEPGRYPLICYSHVHGDNLILTGFDIWDAEKKYPNLKNEGELLIFRSQLS